MANPVRILQLQPLQYDFTITDKLSIVPAFFADIVDIITTSSVTFTLTYSDIDIDDKPSVNFYINNMIMRRNTTST